MKTRFLMSSAPAISRIGRRLGVTAADPGQVAAAIEIHPAERLHSPSTIYLPGEFEKATGTMASTTLAEMRRQNDEGEFDHGPTRAYCLRNVILANGSYYAGRHWRRIAKGAKWPFIAGRIPSYAEAQMVDDLHFHLYFGHWLVDGLMLELLAQRLPSPQLAFRRGNPRYHEPAYRRMAALEPEAISVAHAEKLWVYDDRGMNRAKRERFLELRRRIRNGLSNDRSGPPVYLARGASGVSRRIADEARLMDTLARRGFDIVEPVASQPEEIVSRLGNAPLLISIEGSHQSHAMVALPSGSRMLQIQPQDRFLHSWKFFGDVAEIRTGFVVAARSGGEYAVDQDRLLKTIDLMTA